MYRSRQAASKDLPNPERADQSSRVPTAPGLSPEGQSLLSLQGSAGNHAVAGLIQTKLRVGPVGDAHEKEADRVADEVVGGRVRPTMQAKGVPIGPVLMQTKLRVGPVGDSFEREADRVAGEAVGSHPSPGGQATDSPGSAVLAPADVEEGIARARNGGRPLPTDVRTEMEAVLGADFGDVRVHGGPEADALNDRLEARAFTTDRDIFLHDGEPGFDSSAGRRLLAHELTHVAQQTRGRALPSTIQRGKKDTKKRKKRRAKKKVGVVEGVPTSATPSPSSAPSNESSSSSGSTERPASVGPVLPRQGGSEADRKESKRKVQGAKKRKGRRAKKKVGVVEGVPTSATPSPSSTPTQSSHGQELTTEQKKRLRETPRRISRNDENWKKPVNKWKDPKSFLTHEGIHPAGDVKTSASVQMDSSNRGKKQSNRTSWSNLKRRPGKGATYHGTPKLLAARTMVRDRMLAGQDVGLASTGDIVTELTDESKGDMDRTPRGSSRTLKQSAMEAVKDAEVHTIGLVPKKYLRQDTDELTDAEATDYEEEDRLIAPYLPADAKKQQKKRHPGGGRRGRA